MLFIVLFGSETMSLTFLENEMLRKLFWCYFWDLLDITERRASGLIYLFVANLKLVSGN
jgi:hypothetical protein